MKSFISNTVKKPIRRPTLSVAYKVNAIRHYFQLKNWYKHSQAYCNPNQQLCFLVTAGRTGTDTLSNIFREVPRVCSLHEPRPSYDIIAREARNNRKLALGFALWKLSLIRDLDCSTYIETSHVLCKGFLEAFLALGVAPRFVILTRSPRAVALSLLNKNAVPGKSAAGKSFLISPAESPFLPISSYWDLSDYQLCFWYALKMQKRADVYWSVFQGLGLNCFSLETKDLNNAERVGDLAKFLEIDCTTRGLWQFSRRNSLQKSDKEIPEHLDDLEQKVLDSLLPSRDAGDVLEEIAKFKYLVART